MKSREVHGNGQWQSGDSEHDSRAGLSPRSKRRGPPLFLRNEANGFWVLADANHPERKKVTAKRIPKTALASFGFVRGIFVPIVLQAGVDLDLFRGMRGYVLIEGGEGRGGSEVLTLGIQMRRLSE